MAKKTETTVTLIDDLDGSKADRTVAFTVEGTSRRGPAPTRPALFCALQTSGRVALAADRQLVG